MRTKLRFLIAFLVALMLLGPVALAAQESSPVASPAASPVAGEAERGVLLANMDPSTDPGDDFYRFATGGWQDRTEIPADEAAYGQFGVVGDLTIEQLLGLLDRLAESEEVPVGSDEWKAVQLFLQAKDLKTRNAQGIAPIEPDFAAIDTIKTLDDFYTFLRDGYLTSSISGLYGIYSAPDLADSSVYTAWYYGPTLGLPNRDYYWVDTPENEAARKAYRETAAKLLGFADYDAGRATTAVQAVYDLEKRLSEPVLRQEEYNDPGNYYHPRPVADLIAGNPDFDWRGFLDVLGIPDVKTVVITEEAYFEQVDDIVAATDLATLKEYLKLQVLWGNAGALSEDIRDTAFAFEQALTGVEAQPPIEEQALGAVNGFLGFALGKLYVEEYFPPEAKAQIEKLVARLVAASRTRVEALTWMDPETKKTAFAKLDQLRVKVGYPDVWRTYENVTIEETLAKTFANAALAEYMRTLALIGKPVDRDEWGMLPQEVNAYYNPSNNEIVFPAGILQAPFFDYRADPASNYGAIGMVIGHEITHGFDQQGSQYDADGNFAEWWTEEDRAEFETLTKEVVTQYGAIEVLPGLNVDGDLTIGENIADLGGLQIAHDALQAALRESGDPGPIDGLTQEQRFFIALAFVWAEETRPEALQTQVQTDWHAPAQVRGVQPGRNMDEFHEAFEIEAGDPMYLPPEERIVIW